MIVNAYYKALAMMAIGANIDVPSVGGNSYNAYFNYNSSQKIFQFYNSLKALASNDTTSGVVVGSGTTPPTAQDYKLENQITTVSGNVAYNTTQDADGVTINSIITVTNTADTDITIGEVGLYVNTSGNWTWMAERTVLETPVTIPAGGVGQVTYTIRMNYPTA